MVTEVVDGGTIIVQKGCDVAEDDSASLKAKVQALKVKRAHCCAQVRDGCLPDGDTSAHSSVSYADAGVNIDEGNIDDIGPCAGQLRGQDAMLLGGFGESFLLPRQDFQAMIQRCCMHRWCRHKVESCSNRWSAFNRRHRPCGYVCERSHRSGRRAPVFLDYFATGKLDGKCGRYCPGHCCWMQVRPDRRRDGRMPSMYAEGDYDLAGFAVGAVTRSNELLPSTVREGNVLLGLPLLACILMDFPRKKLVEHHRTMHPSAILKQPAMRLLKHSLPKIYCRAVALIKAGTACDGPHHRWWAH